MIDDSGDSDSDSCDQSDNFNDSNDDNADHDYHTIIIIADDGDNKCDLMQFIALIQNDS